MGRRETNQKQLFYAFDLDAVVPDDHLLRGIDACLDLSDLRLRLAPFYSHTGRPSIDPELMIRMLIVGYAFGIRSNSPHCAGCHLKSECCPNTPGRKIARSVHEEARDYARSLRDTPEYWQSRKDRKKVEMAFAHLKRILKLDRLRLRGLSGANDELLLAATALNLRKMANMIWKPPKIDRRSVSA